MAIGPTLQEARLKKQLTTSQIAEMTRMKVQIVDDLEHDDFHRVAAVIYGKGFIKLFAECVDLDPTPLIADYMRTVKGEGEEDSLTELEPQETVKPEPDSSPSPSEEEKAPVSDLFEFASSRRRRITPTHAHRPSGDSAEVLSPSASSPTRVGSLEIGKDAPVPSRQQTRSVHRPLSARIRSFLQPLLDRSSIMIESLKGRLANFAWTDRMLRNLALVLGGVIVLLVLIAVVRNLMDRTGPRPPADHELMLFAPPPEPYLE